MPIFRYGGKRARKRSLVVSSDCVVIRTRDRGALEPQQLSKDSWRVMGRVDRVFRFEGAGVEVHRVRTGRGKRAARDEVRKTLKTEPGFEFVGRVLCERKSRSPVIYTENLFVKFDRSRSERYCRKLIKDNGLQIKRDIPYLDNAFFVTMKDRSGQAVFDAAELLLAEESVEYCHPELLKQVSRRVAFPEQWHLKKTGVGSAQIDAHANVESAWALTKGEGIVIAIIDDGIDIDHEEFASPDKIVAPRDVAFDSDDPRPGADDNHGTPCAGVACADGLHHASGVAPHARLMPIRLKSGLGSQDEADALQWAAEKGADVISCSWGPSDGPWRDPADPKHKVNHPLPDSTREAMEWATDHGRQGKGCVITWSAGNGGESVDLDGYASCERVMAIAACDDRGKRSAYSDHGKAIWCCFPSKGTSSPPPTKGIWTTDRTGPSGYNTGRSKLGDRQGNYINRFRGTSSSCPGVAGVAALMLAVNPSLTWREVRDAIRSTCDKIDKAAGSYDINSGHSPLYGYGRINAERAVRHVLVPERRGVFGVSRTGSDRRLKEERLRTEIVIRMKTTIKHYSVRLDDRALRFQNGAAKTCLDIGKSYVLTWWVSGDAGESYDISIEAGAIRVGGRFPIRRTIPKGQTKSGGTSMLSLSSKGPR